MPGGQQQSQTSDTGTTPMQQTDWRARADAAASIPNPMCASRAGTTPMQQTDWRARADAAASVPNPMYASRAGESAFTTPIYIGQRIYQTSETHDKEILEKFKVGR
uniref:Uncharacterized protein n=1 Tax=Branchiostoma floridae TaxID=7739 RepID=C3YB39_BRAFL|eukprot:XP_002606491.1 hypothetical protein BRAFLDRAFT_91927 [Branchiostoma floridae]